MSTSFIESQIFLAIEATRTVNPMSIRAAAKAYNVPEPTLRGRINGRTQLAMRKPNNMVLSSIEEETLVRYIIDTDARGFAPRILDVEDMANLIVAARTITGPPRRVGTRWAQRFVQRRDELKTRFSRVYDFQRAFCEDFDVMEAWFRLVANMCEQYGISYDDIYNFDETGFMMGVISASMVVTGSERRGKRKKVQPGNREWVTAINCISSDGHSVPPFLIVRGTYHLTNWYTEANLPPSWTIKLTENGWTNNETGLEWLQHFEKHTAGRTKGTHRLLVIDGHASHQSVEFQDFCTAHNIITVCLPPHSSHLTQPLDVGIFGPLKRSYGRQIESFIKSHVNNITKVEFFIAYQAAYNEVFTQQNIQSSFRGAGLCPHDPQAVLSKMDVRVRPETPILPPQPSCDSWTSQTPHNSTEANFQSTLIKNHVVRHESSSPSQIINAIDKLAKYTESNSTEIALLRDEVRNLRTANEALSKRRRAKKKRLQRGGVLNVQDAHDLLAHNGIADEGGEDNGKNGGTGSGRAQGVRRCGVCKQVGHNARTCQVAREISDESGSA
jgi:hypothetical protein